MFHFFLCLNGNNGRRPVGTDFDQSNLEKIVDLQDSIGIREHRRISIAGSNRNRNSGFYDYLLNQFDDGLTILSS